jgi:hypothetical protein
MHQAFVPDVWIFTPQQGHPRSRAIALSNHASQMQGGAACFIVMQCMPCQLQVQGCLWRHKGCPHAAVISTTHGCSGRSAAHTRLPAIKHAAATSKHSAEGGKSSVLQCQHTQQPRLDLPALTCPSPPPGPSLNTYWRQHTSIRGITERQPQRPHSFKCTHKHPKTSLHTIPHQDSTFHSAAAHVQAAVPHCAPHAKPAPHTPNFHKFCTLLQLHCQTPGCIPSTCIANAVLVWTRQGNISNTQGLDASVLAVACIHKNKTPQWKHMMPQHCC